VNNRVEIKNSGGIWFLLLGISTVTVYFKTDAEDPFNTPKLLILMVIGSYLSGHLINNFRLHGIWGNSKDRAVYTLSFAFLISLLISTLLTEPRLNGFIGDTQRRNGFLSYFMLVIIFLFAYSVFEEIQITRLFVVAILTGFILSGYGILQINGKDFVQWVNPYNSMISTLGNPNFASAMLAIFSSVGFTAIFLKQVSNLMKTCSIFLILFSIYCILKSDSRQGLVTFFFSILFYLTLYIYFNYKKLSILTFFLATGISTTVILGMLQKGPLAYWLYKDSVSVRGFYWRAGIKMLQDNFLTGVGVDRYGSFFKYYREVEYPLRYGYDITSSNAHNTIIQIFSTAGFFAGLSYVGLITYVLFTAIGFIKNTKGEQQLIVISLISIWVGFQAQSIISIDNIGVSVWGWLLSGAILGYIKSTNLKKDNIEIKSRKITSNKVQINLFQPAISTLAVLLILVIVIPIYRSETNSYLVKSLGNNLTEQNKGTLFNYSKKVIDNKFADPTYKFKAALYMYDAGYLAESISTIEDLEIKDPKNLDFLNGLAYIYVKQGRLQDAIKVRKLITENDPWNAENYLSLGSLLVQTGDNDLAKVYLSKITSFAPNTEVATKSKEIINSLG